MKTNRAERKASGLTYLSQQHRKHIDYVISEDRIPSSIALEHKCMKYSSACCLGPWSDSKSPDFGSQQEKKQCWNPVGGTGSAAVCSQQKKISHNFWTGLCQKGKVATHLTRRISEITELESGDQWCRSQSIWRKKGFEAYMQICMLNMLQWRSSRQGDSAHCCHQRQRCFRAH